MTNAVLFLIRMYQTFFSPDHARLMQGGFQRCRFYPSCSEYAASVIRQYGLRRGFVFSLLRILRCHPFSRGGYDPVPHGP